MEHKNSINWQEISGQSNIKCKCYIPGVSRSYSFLSIETGCEKESFLLNYQRFRELKSLSCTLQMQTLVKNKKKIKFYVPL